MKKNSYAAEATKSMFLKCKKEEESFGFKAEKGAVHRWRTYCRFGNFKLKDIGYLAMEEYIARHPLPDEQHKAYYAACEAINE